MATDERNANPAPETPPVLSSPPRVALTVMESVRLARGFDFLFAGGVVTIMAVAEMMMSVLPRLFSTFVCGAGLILTVNGTWQLSRVRGLGASWRTRTFWLLVVALATGYLFPFFCVWRTLSRNLYFCGHALAMFAGIIATMILLAWTIGSLALVCERRMLWWQAMISIGAALFVQVAPFLTMACVLWMNARQGEDPLLLLQYLLSHLNSIWVSLWLLPFTLTLSLAWEAKELALEQLREHKP